MGGASAVTALLVGLSAVSFVLAAAAYPGGYDPAMRMMSALGQTEVRLVEMPWCLYFFVAGMFLSASGVALSLVQPDSGTRNSPAKAIANAFFLVINVFPPLINRNCLHIFYIRRRHC